MRLSLDPRVFMAFLLASTRCIAWLSIAPPFKGLVPAKIRAGLGLALGIRILLLLSISWVIGLKEPLFAIWGHPFAGKDRAAAC